MFRLPTEQQATDFSTVNISAALLCYVATTVTALFTELYVHKSLKTKVKNFIVLEFDVYKKIEEKQVNSIFCILRHSVTMASKQKLHPAPPPPNPPIRGQPAILWGVCVASRNAGKTVCFSINKKIPGLGIKIYFQLKIYLFTSPPKKSSPN